MNRRGYIFAVIMSLLGLVTTNSLSQTATAPSGSGTSGDPYVVATLNNLYWVSQNDTAWARYYKQTADIDASATSGWNSGHGLPIIGNGVTGFSGTYDGNGHTISHLTCDRDGLGDYAGMFGLVNGGATLKNLGLIDVHVTGNVAGGLCAALNGSTVNNCYSTGSVTGDSYIGGLIGQIVVSALAHDCFSTCTVSGSSLVGGLAGYNFGSTVTNCYSIGSVTGSNNFGGLVGSGNGPTTNNSYWNTETSGLSSSTGGTGLTTAQMKDSTNYTGWDFSSVWGFHRGINNGYPYLRAIRPYPADNYSAAFNGSTAYVLVPDNSSLDLTSSYTIEAWIKPASFATLAGIVSKYQTSGSNGYLLRLTGSNPYTGIGFDGMETANGILTSGTWYHIAAVNNNGSRTLYVNGTTVSLTGIAITVQANSDSLKIGCDYSSRYFDGLIDEVRIWNTARTQSDIREDMFTALTGSESGLAAYWNFNEGLDSAADASSGNTGTFQGGAGWSILTPVAGTGSSNTQTVSSTGGVSFGSTNFGSDFTSNSGTNTFVVSAIQAFPTGSQSPAVGTVAPLYWVVSEYGSGAFAATMTFTTGSNTISAGDQASPSNLKLFNRAASGDGAWTQVATASSATSTTVTFVGITDVGQFTIGTSGDSPLPVELASFSAKDVGGSVTLKWMTATEVNNFGFAVERREGASKENGVGSKEKEWQTVGSVKGTGTSNSAHEYSFVDKRLTPGLYAYRIRQTDRTGKAAYSGEQEVAVGGAPRVFSLTQNYPNPFNPTTTIEFTLPSDGRIVLKIYDIVGREVATLVNKDMKAGVYQQAVFDGTRFASGVYFARLQFDGRNLIKKLMLLK